MWAQGTSVVQVFPGIFCGCNELCRFRIPLIFSLPQEESMQPLLKNPVWCEMKCNWCPLDIQHLIMQSLSAMTLADNCSQRLLFKCIFVFKGKQTKGQTAAKAWVFCFTLTCPPCAGVWFVVWVNFKTRLHWAYKVELPKQLTMETNISQSYLVVPSIFMFRSRSAATFLVSMNSTIVEIQNWRQV